MAPTLLLRFHAFGDVVLTTGVVRELARRSGGAIDIGTDAAWRPLFRENEYVGRLLDREELRAAADGGERWGGVVDLQGSPGARRLARRLGRARHLQGASLPRRWLVFWGNRPPHATIPHAVARYAHTAGLDPSDLTSLAPRVRVTESHRDALEREAPELARRAPAPRIALLPGASRRSKQIPPERFAAVARTLRNSGCQVHVFTAPSEAPPLLELPTGVAPAHALSLSALIAALATCSVAVANDSGPMHLAAALGVPVVALFGSSVPELGFEPLGAPVDLLSAGDLACRPCGVHGRDRCWLGHWACLAIEPARIAERVLARLGDAASGGGQSPPGASSG